MGSALLNQETCIWQAGYFSGDSIANFGNFETQGASGLGSTPPPQWAWRSTAPSRSEDRAASHQSLQGRGRTCSKKSSASAAGPLLCVGSKQDLAVNTRFAIKFPQEARLHQTLQFKTPRKTGRRLRKRANASNLRFGWCGSVLCW